MVGVTDAEIEAAEAQGQRMLRQDPRASTARYDRIAGRVVIELTNGCAYSFPAGFVQDLQGAGSDDLAEIEVDGCGFNLHWPALDVDLYVPALVSGIFGTRAWMMHEAAEGTGPKEDRQPQAPNSAALHEA